MYSCLKGSHSLRPASCYLHIVYLVQRSSQSFTSDFPVWSLPGMLSRTLDQHSRSCGLSKCSAKLQRVVCTQETTNDPDFISLSFEIFRPSERPRSWISWVESLLRSEPVPVLLYYTWISIRIEHNAGVISVVDLILLIAGILWCHQDDP